MCIRVCTVLWRSFFTALAFNYRVLSQGAFAFPNVMRFGVYVVLMAFVLNALPIASDGRCCQISYACFLNVSMLISHLILLSPHRSGYLVCVKRKEVSRFCTCVRTDTRFELQRLCVQTQFRTAILWAFGACTDKLSCPIHEETVPSIEGTVVSSELDSVVCACMCVCAYLPIRTLFKAANAYTPYTCTADVFSRKPSLSCDPGDNRMCRLCSCCLCTACNVITAAGALLQRSVIAHEEFCVLVLARRTLTRLVSQQHACPEA